MAAQTAQKKLKDIPRTKQLLADNLRSLREIHGYTQVQVAEMVGIQKTTVCRCENRDHDQFPDPELIDAFARFYQVSIGDLFRVHGTAEKNFSIVATLDSAMGVINKYLASGELELKRRKK